MNRAHIITCTNCGKISPRVHILPLCDSCFAGLEDYEDFLAKSDFDSEIIIDKTPVKPDDFLRL